MNLNNYRAKIENNIQKFQVTYDIIRNGARYTGTKNACQVLDNAHGEVLSIIDSVDAPRHCPVKEVNYLN